MKATPRLTHWLLFSLLLSLTATVSAQDATATEATTDQATVDGVTYSLERLTWEETMEPGQKLIVENPWGDIRVRQTGDNNTIVHAVMQKIGEQPKVGALKHERTDATHRIYFTYPGDQQPENFQEGRIDVVIALPYGVDLTVYAQRGEVSSKTLNSPITVHAKSAPVSLKSRNVVTVKTESAPVKLALLGGDLVERGSIQTLSGDIEIRYFKDQAIAVDMVSGAGKTTNDLPLLQSRSFDGRTVKMTKGDKPPHLNLKSDTGHIILYDLSAEHPEAAATADDE